MQNKYDKYVVLSEILLTDIVNQENPEMFCYYVKCEEASCNSTFYTFLPCANRMTSSDSSGPARWDHS